MDCSTPGLPVHHHLPGLAQTHVHWVSDAIQPSHPLSSPFPTAFYLSQHQSLFQWVSSLHQVAKVRTLSFSIIPSNEYSGLISFLRLPSLVFLKSIGLYRVFSNTTIWKHQFFSAQPLWANSHIHTWQPKNHSFDYMDLCQQSNVSAFWYAP